MLCRFHVQTAGSSLTAQSIDNNVVRTTVQALAAVLGGAQSLHTNSRDEALALPTEEAARLALRTQQILAYEAGVTETPDPLAGSYYVESLTNELEAAAWAYLDEIEALGGTLAAIERGFQQREIQEAAYRVQRAVESGDQVVVGVNKFRDDEVTTPPTQRIDPEGERRQVERVRTGPRRALGRGLDGGHGRARAGRPRRRQPHAGDPRGGPGLCHGRRDQRPPARGLGRAPRAHHGLTVMEDVELMRPDASRSRRRSDRLGKVHHVALIVASIEAALGLWRDMLGLELETVMDIAHDRVRIAFLGVGESKIELVQPTDDTTGVARFLASKGEGFHHVCFEVAEPRRDAAPPRDRRPGAHRHGPAPRRRGPGRVHPPALVPRRPRRADRGARRAGLGGARVRAGLAASASRAAMLVRDAARTGGATA